MGLARPERRKAFLEDLDDWRHGTKTGYWIAHCTCPKCEAYREEYNRMKREEARAKAKERMRYKYHNSNPKPKPTPTHRDICTVDESLKPMMGKPTIRKPYCVVCGSTEFLEQHHPVKRSEGTMVVNGHEVRKPTLTLCRRCHEKVHSEGRLYFRWVDASKATRFNGMRAALVGEGWYEFLEITKEREREWKHSHMLTSGFMPSKIGYMNALEMDGWERIL